MARVITLANQKGGVGKTTTAVNLSAALALSGKRVLVIDVDPQGNTTSGFGIDKNNLQKTMYDVFAGEASLEEVLVGPEKSPLKVAPANSDLVGIEIEIATTIGRELILKEQLNEVKSQYDYVFIDCPPSLGLLTVNAFVASDSVLVPLQCEYYALEGISALVETIRVAKERLNKDLEVDGVVLTMYDGRTNLARQVAVETKGFFKDKVFKTIIPRNVRLSECPSFGCPIFAYDPQSPGAVAYKALARELEKRLRVVENSEHETKILANQGS